MTRVEKNGKRKTRDQLSKQRIPELGYYFIVTDTKKPSKTICWDYETQYLRICRANWL